MLEIIDLYEGQKAKYRPVIQAFERELDYYVGDDLSTFKLEKLRLFRDYLNSEEFITKMSATLKNFRLDNAKRQLSEGTNKTEIKAVAVQTDCGNCPKPTTKRKNADWITLPFQGHSANAKPML